MHHTSSSTQTWRHLEHTHNYIRQKANADCDCFVLYHGCGLYKSNKRRVLHYRNKAVKPLVLWDRDYKISYTILFLRKITSSPKLPFWRLTLSVMVSPQGAFIRTNSQDRSPMMTCVYHNQSEQAHSERRSILFQPWFLKSLQKAFQKR